MPVVRSATVARDVAERAKAMRRAPTAAEGLVRSIVRGRGVHGLKFRRQQPIAGFIVDFYCAEHRIALEVDGAIHDRADARDHDEARTRALTAMSIRVVRIRNDDVHRATLERLLAPHATTRTPLP